MRLTFRMLCTAPDTNTLKANREGGRPVPSTLGAERERPGAARSSPVAAGLGQGVRGSGTAPHPARPGRWLPGMQNPARAIELSLGRQTRAHGGLRACLPLTAGRESILAWLRQGCLGGQVLSQLDIIQEGQQGQGMPVARAALLA